MKFEEIYKKVLDADKKFKELGIPISLDFKIEDLRDALIESFETLSSINAERDALRKENAYLRRLALHALSSYAMGMSLVNYLDPRGTRKKQIAYFIASQKFENLHNIEKDKWRKEKCKK